MRQALPNLSATDAAKLALLQAQKSFLATFSALGNVTGASDAAGISRQTHYDWLESDPTYPERFKQAQTAFGDRIHGKFTEAIITAEPREILLHPVAAIAELKRWFPEYRDSTQINLNVDARSIQVGDAKQALEAIRQAKLEAG